MGNSWISGVFFHALAGLAVLVGAGSFVVFGWFLDGMGLGVVRLGWGPWAAAGIDMVLCLVFFAQHSGMVRRGFREWSERWVPAWLSRAIYTFASALALVLMAVLWQRVDEAPLVLGGPWGVALRGVSLVAVLSFVWAFVSIEGFDAFGSVEVLARWRGQKRAAVPLSIRGPYRWVRHPFYFLVLVMLWATPVIGWDRVLLAVLFSVWIVLGTRWEERDLVAQYGEEYRRYQALVPMLVPWRVRGAKAAAAVSGVSE